MALARDHLEPWNWELLMTAAPVPYNPKPDVLELVQAGWRYESSQTLMTRFLYL